MFCPADRPERFEKAAAAADVVILDLEDGGGEGSRGAREALVHTQLDPARTVVRINPTTTEDHRKDLEVLKSVPHQTVMLAKNGIASRFRAWTFDVVALLETPSARSRQSRWPGSTTPSL